MRVGPRAVRTGILRDCQGVVAAAAIHDAAHDVPRKMINSLQVSSRTWSSAVLQVTHPANLAEMNALTHDDVIEAFPKR